MYIFCSPTKTMKLSIAYPSSIPLFQKEALMLADKMKQYSLMELVHLYGCNEAIANMNKQRWHDFLMKDMGNALLSFTGLQFNRINAQDFNEEEMEYASEHIRILSGLYGCLRPLDKICEYRLDVENKVLVEGNTLTECWRDKLANMFEDELLIDCASQEYSAILPKHRIRIEFKVNKNGILKNEATAAKIARGLMIRYCVKKHVEKLEEIKGFNEDGYYYEASLSSDNYLLFIKEEIK